MEEPEKIVALYDPGEVGREEHNRGDRAVVAISNLAAWLFPALMIAICSQVVLRQMGNNLAWLDDLQWWLYGIACLVGIGYAVTTNSHVRVDIFYDNFDERKKNRINVFALGWLFLPFVILCADITVHYAWASVIADEGSDSPNGLHNLWILKVLMFLSFPFIGLAAFAAYRRYLDKLTTPALWKTLLYMLPSTMFLLNLAVYYVIWWYLRLTSPAEVNDREISRSAIFDEYELGSYDLEYTVLITVVVTALVIGLARLFARRSEG